jgi:SCY1-like protein 2
MATLAVHEAMGSKVDREAVATLVLPQLWAMSMGPRKLFEAASMISS